MQPMSLCGLILRGTKLQGGSLFYALAISVIIAMLTCSILLADHFSRMSIVNDITTEEVIRNAESGIVLGCGDEAFDYSDGKEIDLFGRGKDSVFIQRKPWGAFDVCISHAHTRNASYETIALIGCRESPEDSYALWLADMDRPLSVTGTTELRGKCYLPKSGVERAYIEGNSYQGSQLVYGETAGSSRFMNQRNEERVKQIETMFNYAGAEHDSMISWNEIESLDTVIHSFRDGALVISHPLPIRITDKSMRGQLCIISTVSIYVSNTSALENVILVSPRIEIEEETIGQFQAFARDSLIVGKEVRLTYPSILAVCSSKSSPEFSGLIIHEGAKIMGEVFGSVQGDDIRKHVTVSIDKDALVYGSVYCNDLVDLKATIIGSVTCSKFVLKTNSAVYENHLMNAVIHRTNRSASYTGSFLFRGENAAKSIVQWVE